MFFRKPPRIRFVILFPGRTGSSHLVSCLSSHGAVLAEGERLVGLDAQAQSGWMSALYDAPRGGGIEAVGFKTKPKDIADRGAFVELLRARSVRAIFLCRGNLVKLAVSTVNARRIKASTGRWNLAAGAAALEPIEIAPDELRHEIERADLAQREARRLAESVDERALTLDYDDLARDGDAWTRRATEFLGVSERPMRSDVAKATDDDLRRALRNHDALAACFADTPWARHFSRA